MIIKTIPAGIYDANCYLIMDEDSKEIVIIDPGGDGEMLETAINSLGGTPKYILLTHGHVDHVGGVEYLADNFKIPFYISEEDEEFILKDRTVFGNIRKADGYLIDNQILPFGKHGIQVINTPGHTKGGVCFLIEDKVFTGDTLFQASIGRTDFVGGSFEDIIKSIKTRLLTLGDEVQVYPGHGPSSTIGYEGRNNPYLD